MSAPPPNELPGKGFLGWLGRQVGYVSKAVKQPVTPPAPARTTPSPSPVDAAADVGTIYRDRQVIELPMPGRPGVLLRRTTIDEAVVTRTPSRPEPTAPYDTAIED